MNFPINFTWKDFLEFFLILTAFDILTCGVNGLFQEGYIYESNRWRKSKDDYNNICHTPGCIKTSRMILNNMEQSVSPCDNFYEFACGKYIKSVDIPDDKSTVNVPHSIGDLLEEKLRIVMEEPSFSDEIKPFQLVKKLYKTCMNTASIEKHAVHSIQKYLRSFGGWPVLEGKQWKKDKFDWKKITYDLHRTGFGSNYLLRLYAFLDPKNSTRTVLFIHQALLGLKREYLCKGLSDNLVKAYYKYMVDVAVMLGATKEEATKELRQSLDFEILLANISLPKEELRNYTALYNPITIEQLQIQYPGMDWLAYINTLLNGVTVDKNEIVILQAPSYVGNLLKLLEITSKRTLANYLFWRVVENNVSFLNSQLRERLLHYTRAVSGSTALPPRWRECVSVVNSGMAVAVGAQYARKYFTKESKSVAEIMVKNIREQLRRTLSHVSWMDHGTLFHAIQKLDAMETNVGYPDELLNNTLLEQYYENLFIYENGYLESVLEITKFERLYEFRSLHQPVNKSSWVDHGNAAVVNAFYTFSENSINLPAGILQGAYFSSDRPRYMNYGAIGTVIGHEIIHGFDDKGRQYDLNGNLIDWWADVTNKNFISRTQCFIDQYSNYMDQQVHMNLNGVNTQGENIADNGGVKAAYMAYRHWVQQSGVTEPSLPGLQMYTPNQMFWLSMANAFCSKSRPEYMRLVITTDEHSPSKFRVLGSLSNLPDFAEDFHCPLGSAMNPKKKCVLW